MLINLQRALCLPRGRAAKAIKSNWQQVRAMLRAIDRTHKVNTRFAVSHTL